MKQTYEVLSATLDVIMEDQFTTRENGGTKAQWEASQAKAHDAVVAAGWTEVEWWAEIERRLDKLV